MEKVTYKIYSRNENLSENDAIKLNRISLLYSDYIWHKESFMLKFIIDEKGPHLEGSTEFGDCIEDEWFIVKLLKDISKDHPEYAVSVTDNDGEFMLIEAAEYLEKGVEPSTTLNKVFLHRGELHMIGQEHGEITLSKGIELIFSSIPTVANEQIQNSINSKIDSLHLQNHKCRLYLPHLAAHLLYHCPSLISLAVDAFYTREAAHCKLFNQMKSFPPETSVPVSVSFTRTLYAQLKSIEFAPPSLFNLPSPNSKEYNSYYLGCKLACGFEILLNTSIQSNHSIVQWNLFQEKLKALHYYRNEIKGSREYQRLEALAKKMYKANETVETSYRAYLLDEMHRIIKEPLVEIKDLKNDENDSDEWMYLEPKDVDKMLPKSTVDEFSSDDENSLDENEMEELKEIKGLINGFENFVTKESGVKGVLVPGDLSDDNSTDEEDSDSPINFDAEEYMKTLSVGLENNERPLHSMEELMAAMDNELSTSEVAKDISLGNSMSRAEADAQLVKNILESFSAQQGLAGPTSSIISSLGLKFPKPNAE